MFGAEVWGVEEEAELQQKTDLNKSRNGGNLRVELRCLA